MKFFITHHGENVSRHRIYCRFDPTNHLGLSFEKSIRLPLESTHSSSWHWDVKVDVIAVLVVTVGAGCVNVRPSIKAHSDSTTLPRPYRG